jgi:hypothetical protein
MRFATLLFLACRGGLPSANHPVMNEFPPSNPGGSESFKEGRGVFVAAAHPSRLEEIR